MEFGGDNVFKLEDASKIEEVPTPVVTLDSVISQKLFDFPKPKSSIAMAGTK